MGKVGSVFHQVSIFGEIGSISSGTNNDTSVFFMSLLISSFVDHTDTVTFVVFDQINHSGFVDLSGLFGVSLANLFVFLHETISDGHAWETFFASVSSVGTVASHTGQQGKIQVESGHQPVDSGTGVLGQHPTQGVRGLGTARSGRLEYVFLE